MNTFVRIVALGLLIALGIFSATHFFKHPNSDDHDHDHVELSQDTHDKDKLAASLSLKASQLAIAGIEITEAFPQIYTEQVYAPGTVKANGFKSYLVSPRTDSVVISRHANLGEHVKKGQALVTLFSETMAQAHADYLTAYSEWRRINQLGHEAVSERARVEANNNYNASYGKLIAFGLTASAIDSLAGQKSSTFGQYALIAEHDGVVLQDDFMQGQRINAGESVMLIADESELWVDANVSVNTTLKLSQVNSVSIALNEKSYQASIIQQAHTIDPKTRTRVIRLSVKNTEHTLHAGMFVKVFFKLNTEKPLMAVPEASLIKNSHGEWSVFTHQKATNTFDELVVRKGRALGPYREVFGLKEGTSVVTQGAFFVAAEMNKSGFDPHNH